MFKQYVKDLSLLLLLLLPLNLFATHVHWLGDYDKALSKAHKEHKQLLVLVVKKNSPQSNKIIKNVFMNKKYIDHINNNMVSVIVMYEGKNSYPIEMYYTRVFPTLFIVNSQKELFLHKPLYGEEITTESLEKMLP